VTKQFEEVIRQDIATLIAKFKEIKPKGEFVIIF
jgi:16S rRNA C1402 (ribose-2'-O) methylase RsmI